MIIFDLDGTLALCEHRRHFVDASKDKDHELVCDYETNDCKCGSEKCLPQKWVHKKTGKKWKPDWRSFYESCSEDLPNKPIIKIMKCMYGMDYYDNDEDVHIWSGRCESVRGKTELWLMKQYIYYNELKMRPVGDSTPDNELKEKWLDEALARGKKVEMVFDDRQKVVDMWRRRGITCLQVEEGDF